MALSDFISSGGGGDIAVGANLRYTAITGTGSEQTILNRSGSGRIIGLRYNESGLNGRTVNNLKMNVDGGGDTTIISSAVRIARNEGTDPFPLPAKYTSSIEIKATLNNGESFVLVHLEES